MLRDGSELTSAVSRRYSTDFAIVSRLEHCIGFRTIEIVG